MATRVVFTTGLIMFLISACTSKTPYIHSNAQMVHTQPSGKHDFSYIRVTLDKKAREWVIYGKLNHPHDGCQSDAQVILSSLNREGITVYSQSLTMRAQSNHQKGWSGAGFRDRIPANRIPGNRLTLTIQDVPCSHL